MRTYANVVLQGNCNQSKLQSVMTYVHRHNRSIYASYVVARVTDIGLSYPQQQLVSSVKSVYNDNVLNAGHGSAEITPSQPLQFHIK